MSVTLDWNGDKYKKAVNTAIIKALTRSINIVDADAKLFTPVDTGILKGDNVLSVDKVGLSARETNKTEYAPSVEFGTKHQKAQPFLRPALNNNKTKINNIFSSEVKKAIGK